MARPRRWERKTSYPEPPRIFQVFFPFCFPTGDLGRSRRWEKKKSPPEPPAIFQVVFPFSFSPAGEGNGTWAGPGDGKGKSLIQNLQHFSRCFFFLFHTPWSWAGFDPCPELWGNFFLPLSRISGDAPADPPLNIPGNFYLLEFPFPARPSWKWLINTFPHILFQGMRHSRSSPEESQFFPLFPHHTREFQDSRQFPAHPFGLSPPGALCSFL